MAVVMLKMQFKLIGTFTIAKNECSSFTIDLGKQIQR